MTDELKDQLEHPNRKGALSPVLQVLLTLRFYASGSFQDICAELIGVDQSTASRALQRVTEAFMDWVPQWIQFPNQHEAERTKEMLFRMNRFPNVVGCIDGTQIRIQAPQEYEHEHVNRKNCHSINVQMVCDADLLFINVIAKWRGCVHDSRILRESALFEAFESNEKPVRGYLLGDSGYMLRDWLMTSLSNPTTRKEKNYNFSQSSTRTTVERSIGIAKRRWHCLRRLRVEPTKACRITTVCLMLHNRARFLKLEDPDSDSASDSDDFSGGQQVTERARVASGKAVRDQLINNYF